MQIQKVLKFSVRKSSPLTSSKTMHKYNLSMSNSRNGKSVQFSYGFRFESLTVQERINCLTTTYPSLVIKLIEAHFEMRESGILSFFKKHTSASQSMYAHQSQNQYSQGLGFGLGINLSTQNSYKQQMQAMYARYDSKIQPHTSYGQKPSHQSGSKQYGSGSQISSSEFPLFELFKSEDSQMRNLGSHHQRQMQEEFLKYIRITDYKQKFDTLTVSPQLVKEPSQFFSLVAEITQHKAFREPCLFKQKGGRVIIDSPQWVKKFDYNFLSVWIIVTLEETLWAHYNFAKKVNIERNVRTDQLNNIFKERAESLQSQEDLAKRWQEIGNLGRKRLIEKLKQKAKEIEEFQSSSDQQSEDSHAIQDEVYNCSSINLTGFNSFQSEDLMSAMNQNQKSAFQNSNPYSQFYTFQKIPLRNSFSRSYNELFLSDPESAFSKMQHHDRDLKEILDFVQTDWAHISPLDVVKFLSETPLEDMDGMHRARKTFLCRELHSLIQEDLRQNIQNQLMNEDLFTGKKTRDTQTPVSQNSTHQSNSLLSQQAQNNKKKQMNSSITQSQKNKPKEKESPESKSSNDGQQVRSRKKKPKKGQNKQQNVSNDDTATKQGEIVKENSIEKHKECQKTQEQEASNIKPIDIKQVTVFQSQQKGQTGGRKKRKGKINTNTNVSQVITDEAIKLTKVGVRKESSEALKDWLPRQMNSSSKNRKTSNRSPTFSSQVCEVTGSSTHSFDDEKFCLGTGPSSGGGLFSDDNITQLESREALKSKEILHLDCEENDAKSNKTAYFLSKLRSDRQTSNLINANQTKRAESGDETTQTDWSAVGSGLIKVQKSNSRESETQQSLKQQLDFKLIFNENSKTVEGDIDTTPTANTGVGSSSDTRMSTSNKQLQSKKPDQAQSKQHQRLSKASKQQFNEDQQKEYANLNVLTASQSADFISKKSCKEVPNQTRSSCALGANDVRVILKDSPNTQGGVQKIKQERKKRSSGSRSSNDDEEAQLIKQFVEQLIERACATIMNEQNGQKEAQKIEQQQHQESIEKTKEMAQTALQKQETDNLKSESPDEKTTQKKQKQHRIKKEVKLTSSEDLKPEEGKFEVSKNAQNAQNSVVKKTSQINNDQSKPHFKAEDSDCWRQPTKILETNDKESTCDSQSAADLKQKRKRNRNKKKNDNELALNNFMRQMAGDKQSDAKSLKPTTAPPKQQTQAKPIKQALKPLPIQPQMKKSKIIEEAIFKKVEEAGEKIEIGQDKISTSIRRKGSSRSNRSKKQANEPVSLEPEFQEENTVDEETKKVLFEATVQVPDLSQLRDEEYQALEIAKNALKTQEKQISVELVKEIVEIGLRLEKEVSIQEQLSPYSKNLQESEIGYEQQNNFYPNDQQEAERRGYKNFGRFEQQPRKQNWPRFGNFNQVDTIGSTGWNDRRREPFDSENASQDQRKYFGKTWNQQPEGQFNVRPSHVAYFNRQGNYSYQNPRYNFDYQKEKNENDNASPISDFKTIYEDPRSQGRIKQEKNTSPFTSQTTFSNYQNQAQFNQGYSTYPKSSIYPQEVTASQAANSPAFIHETQIEQNFKFQSTLQDSNNPFLERVTRQSFIPQTNQLRNASHENQQLQSTALNVEGNRGSSQRSDDRNKTFPSDFQPEEITKQYSADCSKSVLSQQSNPFHPVELNQTWSQTGPQSPFNPSRGAYPDSGFSSPVQPTNYVKFGNMNQNLNIFGDNPNFSKYLDNIVRPIDNRAAGSLNARIPQNQFDRYPQDLSGSSNFFRTHTQVYQDNQEQNFDQFGVGLNNRRVSSYQATYHNPTPMMHFIVGVGDPMSRFNDADPQQRLMENDFLYKQIEEAFYKEFDVSINSYIDGITQTVDQYKKEREFVFEKIQSIANKVFENQSPLIQMFGSLMTGLALETSDMDMVVSGLNISDRQVMIDEMHNLADGLNSWDMVQDLKAIDTASIPVIKAKINLKVLRAKECGQKMQENQNVSDQDILPIDITFDDSPSYPQPSSQNAHGPENYSFQFGLTKFPSLGGYSAQTPGGKNYNLEVLDNFKFGFQNPTYDVASDDSHYVPAVYSQQQKTHLGLASCKLIKDYVTSYPYLKEVAVLLKRFLAVHDFNSAYLGGISSYSAVLLIVAYMNYFKLHQIANITPSRLLMGFLDFYSNCFDARKYGIKTINQMSYYPLPSLSQQMFVIVDPVNPSNNTARNSYRTPDVLKNFREAFKRLKGLIHQRYHEEKAKESVESQSSANEIVTTLHEMKAGQSQAPFEKKEQPTNRRVEDAKSQQQVLKSTTDSSELVDACDDLNDSFQFTVQLKDSEQAKLSFKKGKDGHSFSTDLSKVFGSVDFVQTFLALGDGETCMKATH